MVSISFCSDLHLHVHGILKFNIFQLYIRIIWITTKFIGVYSANQLSIRFPYLSLSDLCNF